MADETVDLAAGPVNGDAALEVELPATATSVSTLRSYARNFAARAGAEEQVVADVALAVSEAATNAVLHAYGGTKKGIVALRGTHEDGWVELEVSDRGGGFRPSPSGGLGFGLKVMAEVSDSMTVEQRDDGTTVVLRFALARPPAS